MSQIHITNYNMNIIVFNFNSMNYGEFNCVLYYRLISLIKLSFCQMRLMDNFPHNNLFAMS